jgi:hypothetical protein
MARMQRRIPESVSMNGAVPKQKKRLANYGVILLNKAENPMKKIHAMLPLLLIGLSVAAQTTPATPAAAKPSPVVATIEGITGKQFQPDTVFAALSEEDETVLTKEPVANWGLPQEAEKEMTYYNLVVGTRSYQLVIIKPPKAVFPTATLLRFTTPKSKPEPIARGTLKPKAEEKPK